MYNQASKLQASSCNGKHENIITRIKTAQQDGQKKCADKDEAACEIIMEQIRANRQVTTLLEDLPLSSVGLHKKAKAEGMGTPFTLLFLLCV